MRVATWNIRHGAPAGRRADLRGTEEVIVSLDADVVALQEVDRRVVRSYFADQAERLGRASGHSAHFAPARRLALVGRYGNALLVRGSVLRLDHLRLRSAGEQRVALFASVEIGAGQIRTEGATVVSTHLQNRRRGRVVEAPAQLDQILEELHAWPRPWVLMGDLNLRPEVVLPRLEDAGMQAVQSAPTYPSDAPRICIDWIAVAGMGVRSVEIPDVRASDHRPIVAELTPDPDLGTGLHTDVDTDLDAGTTG